MISRKSIGALLLVVSLLCSGCAEPAKRLYDGARASASKGEWEASKKLLFSLLEKYPQSRFAPGAAAKLGDIFAFVDKNIDAAIEIYDYLVFKYPQSSLVPLALVRQAEIIKERKRDPVAAAELLERIYQNYPEFRQGDLVLILMARCLESMKSFTRERVYLRELLLSWQGSPYIEEAQYLYGMSCLGDELIDEALLTFKSFLSTFPESRFASKAEIGYAETLKERHGKGEAAKYLAAVMERYPNQDRDILTEELKILESKVPLSRIKIPGRKLRGRR